MMSCPVFSMLLGILSSTISECCPAQCSACCSVFCPPQFQHDVLPSFQHVARYFVLNNFNFSMLFEILSMPQFQHPACCSVFCPQQFQNSACCSLFCPPQFQHDVLPCVQHVARYFVLHNFSMLSSPVFSMLLGILSSTISA